MRILAISDIHGCSATFKALLKRIQFSKDDHLFLIGDFVDRGPNSKGVIDHIWELQGQGFTITCLKGNHEEMLLKGQSQGFDDDLWLYHGGKQTLASFDAYSTFDISKRYLNWMADLPLYTTFENYIFVHAGLNFEPPNPLEAEYSMLWIRNWYDNIDYDWLGDRIIVHGHTPIAKIFIKKMFEKLDQQQYLDIDAGCVFPQHGYGDLCAADLSNRKLYFERKVK